MVGWLLFRIASETPDYTADDLSGGGAAKTGGRWNSVGSPVVYCARNRALAYLETLVHLLPALKPGIPPPKNRCIIEIKVPNSVWAKRHVAQKDSKFPGDWNVHPAGKGSVDYGTAWLAAKTSALLVVPSVIVPQEENVLINPLHPDAKTILATNTGYWEFDHRFFP
jgi:RES domain-containing protein